MKNPILTLILLVSSTQAFSQTFTLTPEGRSEIFTCEGLLSYSDLINSGSSINEMVIKPDEPGKSISLKVSSFNANVDYLYLFNDSTTYGNFIGVFSHHDPYEYTATNPNGQFILRYSSNGLEKNSNFEVFISCVDSAYSRYDLNFKRFELYNNNSFYAGNTVVPSLEVYNSGLETVERFKVDFFLSKDQLLDESDYRFSEDREYFLRMQSSVIDALGFYIPNDIEEGEYHILAVIDYEDSVKEFHEDNNIINIPINVLAAENDLVARTLSLSNSIVPSGGNFTLSSGINNDKASTALNVSNGIFLSTDTYVDDNDIQLDTFTINPIYGNSGTSFTRSIHIAKTVAPGQYYLLYKTDLKENISEVNENNNIAFFPISIVNQQKDLYSDFLNNLPSTLLFGISTGLNGKVYNDGNIISEPSTLGIFLSSDSLYSEDDYEINLYEIPEISNGSYSQRSISITIPEGVEPGNYFLLAVSDINDSVSEINEKNNIEYKKVSVEIPFYNLEVTKAEIEPDSIEIGQAFSIETVVKNSGNRSVSSLNVGFYSSPNSTFDLDAQFLEYAKISLNPGDSIVLNIGLPKNLTDSAGNFYIYSVADYSNKFDESNDLDNIKSDQIKLYEPEYDLELENVQLSDSTIISGRTINISGQVHNIGISKVNTTYIAFYLSNDSILDVNDDQIQTSQISAIEAGNTQYYSINVTISSSTPLGDYYIIVKVDNSELYAETNEVNNISSIPVSITPPHIDLRPSNPVISTTDVITEIIFDVSTTVNNLGNINSSSFYIQYLLSQDSLFDPSDLKIAYLGGSGIANGFSKVVSGSLLLPASIEPGEYYLLHYVDILNNNIESDESNNITYSKINVVAPDRDLSVISFNFTRSEVTIGESLNARATIQNEGEAPAKDFYVSWYLSTDTILDETDKLESKTYIKSLDTGVPIAFGDAVSTTNLEPGEYYIVCKIDHENLVSERNESNNTSWQVFTVVIPEIDFTLYNSVVSSAKVKSENLIKVSFKLLNTGSNLYRGSDARIGIYFSDDPYLSQEDTLLATHDIGYIRYLSYQDISKEIQIPNKPLGDYYILIELDDLKQIPETNENNNSGSLKILISDPFIDLVSFFNPYNDFQLTSGEPVNLKLSTKNSGNETSTMFSQKCYLSTDSILSQSDLLLGSNTISELGYGESFLWQPEISIPQEVASGSYYLIFQVDAENSVTESNEQNNISVMPVEMVNSKIDLMISEFQMESSFLIPGSGYHLNTVVKNKGSVWSGEYKSYFILSTDTIFDNEDIILYEQDFMSLRPQDSAKTSFSPYFPEVAPGYYKFLVVTQLSDPLGTDYDMSNNILWKNVEVSDSYRDIWFDTWIDETFLATPGSEVDLNFLIGSHNFIDEELKIAYYISSDSMGVFNGNVDLLHESTITMDTDLKNLDIKVNIPSDLEKGLYYIFVHIDPENEVVEQWESNNYSLSVLFLDVLTFDLKSTHYENIALYPNPTTGIINISGIEGRGTFKLTDQYGNMALNQSVENDNKINISHLPVGIYISTVETNGNIKVGKLIISR